MPPDVVITPQGIQQRSLRARVGTALPLLRLWVARDLKARYRQSTLRASWSVVQPVVMLVTYGWVFTAILDVGTEQIPYLTFAWAGLVAYSFVQQCLGTGVGAFLDSAFIVSKVYFPREVLPLVVVGVACVDLAITFAILVAVAWVQVGPPTIHLLGALASLVVLVVLTAAVTVACAATAVRHRDLRHAMPLVLRVLFIVSPIMYSIDLIVPKGGWIIELNPLTVVIEGIRDGVIRHQWPDPLGLVAYGILGVVGFVAALGVVRRAERLMTDRL